MKNWILLWFMVTSTVGLCQRPSIEGLWLVANVKVGSQEMTPNAKWTRFHSDGTQQSGNGWKQHSIGTWIFDDSLMELTIFTKNGIADPFGPFQIELLSDSKMQWTREEEGDLVVVSLEKVSILPMTYGDQLLGLWQLQESTGAESMFADASYLFIRWDGKYVIGTKEGRKYGVYNVHGHKPEIELIPYAEGIARSFWKIEFRVNEIVLQLTNDETVSGSFVRVNEFPE